MISEKKHLHSLKNDKISIYRKKMLIIPSKKRDVCSFVVLMAKQRGNNRRLEKSHDEKRTHIAWYCFVTKSQNMRWSSYVA
jgi:hypothetical protein